MSVSTESPHRTTSAGKASLRDVLPLCLASFSGLLTVGVVGAFVAVIAVELNVSVPWIEFTATVALVTTAVTGLFVGWMADARGFRPVLVGGLSLLVASGLGAAVAFTYVFFLISRSIGSVGFAAASGLPNAIVANRYDGADRQRLLGYIAAASVLAGLIGPPALTFVGDLTSWRAAFGLVACIALVAAIGTRLTVPATDTSEVAMPSLREGLRAYATLVRTGMVRLTLLATILQMASLIGMLTYLGAFLTQEMVLEVRYTGLAFAIQSLGGLLGSVLAGRLPESHTRLIYCVTMSALALTIVGIYVLPVPLTGAAGLLFVAGLSQVTAWVTLVGFLARTTTAGKGPRWC